MEAIQKQNYNQTYRINNREISCYDKKMMKELYPSGDYSIVGETFEGNKKDSFDTIILGRKRLKVSKYGSNSKILYKRVGFLLVGEDEYIALLQSRLLFIILLFLILLIGVTAGIWGINTLKNAPILTPDYPLPPEDDKSSTIKNDKSVNTDTTHKNHASIKVAREVTISLSNNKVSFIYQNFNASNKDAVVTLCVLKNEHEYIIARSGLIKSGKELREMDFIQGSIKLTEGVYKGRIKIDFYDEKTGEKAATSTNFDDVEIKVK